MILVTGATGNVGAAVVECLRERGVAYRAAVRKPSAGEAVAFDFENAATYRPALAGCTGVFLLRPPQIADTKRTLAPFVDAARAAGVQHLVFVSVVGANVQWWLPHYTVEQRLRQGPGDWTILQPGFFAQNFGDAYRTEIVQNDRVYLPAGRAEVAFIDVRDVAEVAVNVLSQPAAYRAQTHVLTGVERVSFEHAAQLLSAEIGRTIRYCPASIAGYYRHLRAQAVNARQAFVQTALHTGLRLGHGARINPSLARLLGRTPRTLREYFRDHRALWLAAERSVS